MRSSTPLNLLTLISYLAAIVISGLGNLVLWSMDFSSVQVGFIIVEILSRAALLVAGISATVAGFTSKTTPGRKAGAGMAGVSYLLLWLVGVLLVFFGIYGIAFYVVSALSALALFASWAIARPFRGPGYFAFLIGLVLFVAAIAVGFLPSPFGLYWLPELFYVILGILATVVAVFVAIAFERPQHAAAPLLAQPGYAQAQPGYVQSQPAYATQGARTNTLALVSLIFGILGGSLVSIILGHIAMSQIRRTREAGQGMAIAGLVLGYFWLVVLTIFFAVQIAGLIAFNNALRSYGF